MVSRAQLRCLCGHMQTPAANPNWNRRCGNKADWNSAEPDEIVPPSAQKEEVIMKEVNTGIVI